MNMDDAFENRKIELVRFIKELHKVKPTGWFEGKADYTSTRDVGSEVDDTLLEKEEIIVRRNTKKCIIISSFLLVFLLALLNEYFKPGDKFLIYLIIPFTLIFFYTFILSFDRNPKIILNKKGIWLNTTDCYYEWHLIGATYIKDEDRVENTIRSLLIYYYDPAEDDFIKVEYKFSDLLNLSVPKISYYVEYWKIKTGNRTPVV